VGTRLVTGGSDSSFTGVYKLAAREKNGVFQPTMKVSDNPEKSTNPGIKQVYRFYDARDNMLADLIDFEGRQFSPGQRVKFHHPFMDYRHFSLEVHGKVKPLLTKTMEGGKRTAAAPAALAGIRKRVIQQLRNFDPTYTRLLNPHIYKVSVSEELGRLKVAMIEERLGNRHNPA